MVTEYVEIIHEDENSLEEIKGLTPELDEIINRILELDPATVHYYKGRIKENYPPVPKNTLIRLGGSLYNSCVRTRAWNLRFAGYSKVMVDKSLSISDQDFGPEES